jgi:AcrR family transcriptional regulator
MVGKFKSLGMIKDEAVKDEIINQAQKLFKQFGLKKTTMDEIAAACGKAKSTLYHYFKNKDEVFDAVLFKELQHLRAAVKANVDQESGLKEKLKTYFRTFHRETIHKINLFRILKPELKSEIEKSNRFNNVIEFEKAFISQLIVDGVDRNEFSGISKSDIPWFSEIILVAFLGIVRYSIEKEGEFDESKFNKVTDVLIPRIFT